jgi:hypothetical protein
MSLLPHAALVVLLFLEQRGVPIPSAAFVGLLAFIPVWALIVGWRRPWWRAFVLGPGVVIATFMTFAVWLALRDGGRWSWAIVIGALALCVLYAMYASVVFAVAALLFRQAPR